MSWSTPNPMDYKLASYRTDTERAQCSRLIFHDISFQDGEFALKYVWGTRKKWGSTVSGIAVRKRGSAPPSFPLLGLPVELTFFWVRKLASAVFLGSQELHS